MQQQYPILYSFRRCPYAMRARMALQKSGLSCELREIVLRNKPGHMVAISPKATVPVLQLQNGQVIDESLEVMLWTLKQHDPDGWLQVFPDESMALISENDAQFKYYLDRYKYFQRYPEHSQLHYRQQGEVFLQKLEGLLARHQRVALMAEYISLADIAIFPFIRQFAKVDWDWFSQSDYRYLVAWEMRLEASDLFLAVMKKYKPWQEQDNVILFPEPQLKIAS